MTSKMTAVLTTKRKRIRKIPPTRMSESESELELGISKRSSGITSTGVVTFVLDVSVTTGFTGLTGALGLMTVVPELLLSLFVLELGVAIIISS